MSVETPATPVEVAPEAVDESTVHGAAETPEPGAEALGDAGKQALERMKAERATAREQARAEKARADALQAKLEGKEAEHAAEQERRNVEAAALAKANDRILKAEVRAAATGALNDPADALLYLDLGQFEVGDDGEVDATAVKAAIDNLVKSKPYLAAQSGPRTPAPDPGQGPRPGEPPSADAEFDQYARAMNLPTPRK